MYDAKTHFAELVERVKDGDEIIVTKHGTPIVRIVAVKQKKSPEERRAAIESWREMSQHITLGGLKAKDLITEGRR
jgi:prevent-host-death family protein